MVNFTRILFLEDFKIIVEGICCGAEITSGELEILRLLPMENDERTH
jgi:hypothetical protein